MDIKIAEFLKEERNMTARDANHIMPKAKIPDLNWENYTPPTVTEVDILAIEQGQIENLECNCSDCFSEVAELNEVEDTTTSPQQQEKSSILRHSIQFLQKPVPASLWPQQIIKYMY